MFSTIVLKFGGIELRPAIRIDVLWKTYNVLTLVTSILRFLQRLRLNHYFVENMQN
jgi:hypothetical protein